MKSLAIIPARGGSKGLKDKNILDFNGKPLIAWTIESALTSGAFDSVIVSTDSERIAEVSKQYGAEVPYLRPAELATDNALVKDVIIDVVNWIKKEKEGFDSFCLLQPTSPLRKNFDIKRSKDLLSENSAGAVIGVCESEFPIETINFLPEDNNMKDFLRDDLRSGFNRQEKRVHYRINGAIYWSKIDYFINNMGFYNDETFAYIMPQERSVDIDSELDFAYAEFLSTRLK